jgi:hypothetical protein
MSERIGIRYYLNGDQVDKESINWDVDHTVRVVGDCAYVTTKVPGFLATRHKAKSEQNLHPNVEEKMVPDDFITVTVVTSRVKETVKTKLIEATKKAKVRPKKKDSLGNTPEFYKELGIDPPEDFKEDLENEIFEIRKSDYEIDEKNSKIRHELIEFMVDNEDFGSTLYVGKDFTVTVKETVEEVEEKIKKSKNGVK